jgi:hypothetical protein
VFAYFMENQVKMDDASIFHDISQTIRSALVQTHAVNQKKTGIARSSFEIALAQLV